jgi:hypothetical protein
MYPQLRDHPQILSFVFETDDVELWKIAGYSVTVDFFVRALNGRDINLVELIGTELLQTDQELMTDEVMRGIAHFGDPLTHPVRSLIEKASDEELHSLLRLVSDESEQFATMVYERTTPRDTRRRPIRSSRVDKDADE